MFRHFSLLCVRGVLRVKERRDNFKKYISLIATMLWTNKTWKIERFLFFIFFRLSQSAAAETSANFTRIVYKEQCMPQRVKDQDNKNAQRQIINVISIQGLVYFYLTSASSSLTKLDGNARAKRIDYSSRDGADVPSGSRQ